MEITANAKSFLKGYHTAMPLASLSCSGCHSPRQNAPNRAPCSELRGEAPVSAQVLSPGQAASVSKPPWATERERTTFLSSLPVTISKWQSHEREVDQISTAATGTCTMIQLRKRIYASSPGQDQAGSIFCKSLVMLWVMGIMATN